MNFYEYIMFYKKRHGLLRCICTYLYVKGDIEIQMGMSFKEDYDPAWMDYKLYLCKK